MPAKSFSYQRILSYMLQERTISSFEKLTGKKYCNQDLITGENGWCDFIGNQEWGEITWVHQKNSPMEYWMKNLFGLSIEEIEKKYAISIDRTTIPKEISQQGIQCQINTHSAIESALEKKLKKTYQYKDHGFLEKGTLILAIFDPMFEGFLNNLEIRFGILDMENLKNKAEILSPDSAFDRILLVDGLSPFDQDPDNRTYELLKKTV